MSALLEVPGVRERVYRLSVEDYHQWAKVGVLPEEIELLRGILVTKLRKSPLHEYAAQRLLKELNQICRLCRGAHRSGCTNIPGRRNW